MSLKKCLKEKETLDLQNSRRRIISEYKDTDKWVCVSWRDAKLKKKNSGRDTQESNFVLLKTSECTDICTLMMAEKLEKKAEVGPSMQTLQNHPTVRKVETCTKMQRREEISEVCQLVKP